jgi:hypothetical protein
VAPAADVVPVADVAPLADADLVVDADLVADVVPAEDVVPVRPKCIADPAPVPLVCRGTCCVGVEASPAVPLPVGGCCDCP